MKKQNKLEDKTNRNVVRDLRSISERKQIHFLDVLRTYTNYVKEGAVGEIPDVLYFDPVAYEKTKQYYQKE